MSDVETVTSGGAGTTISGATPIVSEEETGKYTLTYTTDMSSCAVVVTPNATGTRHTAQSSVAGDTITVETFSDEGFEPTAFSLIVSCPST